MRKSIAIAAASFLTIVLGFTAHERAKVWAGSEILFRDALAKNDGSVVMHYNLGVLAFRRGNIEEAEHEYRRAIELLPTYTDAYRGLARLAKDRGDRAESIRILRDAIAAKPDEPEILNDLGGLLIDEGAYAEAVLLLERAVAILPGYADAYANLGTAYGKLERYEDAVRALKEAQRLRAM